MSFNLTGYEKDNIQLKTLALYTVIGIATLFIILFALLFYYNLEKENLYNEIVLKAGTEETVEFQIKQKRILDSYGNKGDDGISSSRVSVNDAIKKTVDHYND